MINNKILEPLYLPLKRRHQQLENENNYSNLSHDYCLANAQNYKSKIACG